MALTELFPMIDMENLTTELLGLAGWRLGWQSTERPAAPGLFSSSQIFNPEGSGQIIVVTQLTFFSNVVNEFFAVEITDTALATAAIPGLPRDGRFGTARRSLAEFRSSDTGPVGGGLQWQFTTEQSVIRDDNGLVVLTPGTGLSIGPVLQNRRMTVNYFWRERIAEPSELNF